MLKMRVLTALCLIAAVLLALFLTTRTEALIVISLVMLLGAWEMSALIGFSTITFRLGYVAANALLMLGLTWQPDLWVLVVIMGLGWWLIALYYVLYFPAHKEDWVNSLGLKVLIGYFILIPCWAALNLLISADRYFLLFLLIIVYGADTAAYCVGKKWGKKPLLKQVSPGKTYEGALGAFVTIVILSLIFSPVFLKTVPFFYALLLSIATFAASVLGDLTESMMKRVSGIKDSGGLLPGHGGILDRIDSLTAASVVFAVGAYL